MVKAQDQTNKIPQYHVLEDIISCFRSAVYQTHLLLSHLSKSLAVLLEGWVQRSWSMDYDPSFHVITGQDVLKSLLCLFVHLTIRCYFANKDFEIQ